MRQRYMKTRRRRRLVCQINNAWRTLFTRRRLRSRVDQVKEKNFKYKKLTKQNDI